MLTQRLLRVGRGALVALGAFGAVAGGFYAHMLWTTNFHPVIAGELYRSSQPSAATIAELQKQFGIKTIINLRGNNGGHHWYDQEVAEATGTDAGASRAARRDHARRAETASHSLSGRG